MMKIWCQYAKGKATNKQENQKASTAARALGEWKKK
jgi:hypothetical protein